MRYLLMQAMVITLLACTVVSPVSEQSAHAEKTFKLDASSPCPQASIEQVDWLVGNWVGTTFGNRFEEVWNSASVGTMVGFFKL